MSTNHPSAESIDTRPLIPMLTTLLAELTDGPPPEEAYILNRGDMGLLRSLDKLTASDASVGVHGGATIAAHVDHLRYGLSLMNRWSAGEQPFETADWAASWRTTTGSDADWQRSKLALRAEVHRWLEALRTPRDVSPTELTGIVASIAHLAYHLGAIRQINRLARGPAEQPRA
jgi:hypothetical protein